MLRPLAALAAGLSLLFGPSWLEPTRAGPEADRAQVPEQRERARAWLADWLQSAPPETPLDDLALAAAACPESAGEAADRLAEALALWN